MTWFESWDRHRTRNGYLAVAAYLLVNNGINATSIWMETTRDGSPGFPLWAPFVWEYTSALAVMLLLPLLVQLWVRTPPGFTGIPGQLGKHLLYSAGFSVLHVLLMVGFRQVIYRLAGGDYTFGNWPRELLYEYRKDLWGYLLFFTGFQLYRLVSPRLRGEAAWIGQALSPSQPQEVPEHLLVKKLDREFLIRVEDIEWMEAAGNYVNLHSNGRIYPLRARMSELSDRLATKGFSRIHRSLAVNHRAIDHITYQPSSDGAITLKNGKVLPLSRRYKDEFKQRLGG